MFGAVKEMPKVIVQLTAFYRDIFVCFFVINLELLAGNYVWKLCWKLSFLGNFGYIVSTLNFTFKNSQFCEDFGVEFQNDEYF